MHFLFKCTCLFFIIILIDSCGSDATKQNPTKIPNRQKTQQHHITLQLDSFTQMPRLAERIKSSPKASPKANQNHIEANLTDIPNLQFYLRAEQIKRDTSDLNKERSVSSAISTNVKTIASTAFAFAALKNDGSVVTWGDIRYSGDSSKVNNVLRPQ